MKLLLQLLLLSLLPVPSLADVSEGEYSARGKKLNIATGSSSSALVSLLVDTGQCSGWVTTTAKIVGDKINIANKDCSISITNHGGFVEVKENQCNYHHGTVCDFSGTFYLQGRPRQGADEYYGDIASKSAQAGVERLKEYVAANYSTKIESSPPGARIILNGEYLGQAPLSVNIRPYLLKGKYDNNMMKATPIGDGCNAVEFIRNIDSPPKRMFFDTGMCHRPNDINIYNN